MWSEEPFYKEYRMEETAVLEPTEADEFATEQAAMEQPPQEQPAPEVLAEPPADCPAHVREHYDAIREKERSVRELEGEYLDAKAAAKDAKERFDLADKALRDLIARGPDPQRSLPFKDETKPADAWRAALLTELFLPDGLHNLLIASGVETIGALEDLRAKIADGKAEWPKGIGEARITELENKVIDWLTENRDKFGEQAEATTTTVTTEEPATDEEADLTAKCEDVLERAGLADKVQRNVTISNGKPKNKKRAFAGRPVKKSKGKSKRR